MPIDVTTPPVAIRRSVADVSAYAFDPKNDPAWIGGTKEITPPAGEVTVGSRVERLAMFLGRRIHYVMEVVDVRPGRLAMHAVKSPFLMDVTYTFDPSPEGTSARIRVSGEPKGYGLLGPLMGAMVRLSVTGDLRRLKRILEAR